jgi:serine phosphatase RsbU (regulator of sigma subunit)
MSNSDLSSDRWYLEPTPSRRWLVLAVIPFAACLLLINLAAWLMALIYGHHLAAVGNVARPLWQLPIFRIAFIALLILAAVSVIAVFYWARMARTAFRATVSGPQTELMEAGDWILRTALGRPTQLHSAHSPNASRLAPESTPIQKELQQWLHCLLEDLQKEYTAHTHEMQRDLNLAREFQQAYMDRPYPKVPAVHMEGRLRLDFYHRYEPALALGGDFYNIMTLGPDAAGIFVSDVMGHGTRSALITAIIRTLIDDLEPLGRNARHFLTEMNRQFCQLMKSAPNPLFASAFYLVADTTARVATYSSAGHPAPFHIRRSVGRVTRLEVPMPRGAALGMIPDEKYTGGYCRLIDGDVFLFFTDGVYEAHNIHGEEFGIARMEDVLRRLMYRSGKEIVDGLMDAIATFVSYEPIMDDICIVAVEVTTKSAP